LPPARLRVHQARAGTRTRSAVLTGFLPVGALSRDQLESTVARLKAFRRGRPLGDLSAKALIEEGRR
jgi:hypothetical protein